MSDIIKIWCPDGKLKFPKEYILSSVYLKDSLIDKHFKMSPLDNKLYLPFEYQVVKLLINLLRNGTVEIKNYKDEFKINTDNISDFFLYLSVYQNNIINDIYMRITNGIIYGHSKLITNIDVNAETQFNASEENMDKMIYNIREIYGQKMDYVYNYLNKHKNYKYELIDIDAPEYYNRGRSLNSVLSSGVYVMPDDIFNVLFSKKLIISNDIMSNDIINKFNNIIDTFKITYDRLFNGYWEMVIRETGNKEIDEYIEEYNANDKYNKIKDSYYLPYGYFEKSFQIISGNSGYELPPYFWLELEQYALDNYK